MAHNQTHNTSLQTAEGSLILIFSWVIPTRETCTQGSQEREDQQVEWKKGERGQEAWWGKGGFRVCALGIGGGAAARVMAVFKGHLDCESCAQRSELHPQALPQSS